MKLVFDIKMVQPSVDADMFDLLVNLKLSKSDLLKFIESSHSGYVNVLVDGELPIEVVQSDEEMLEIIRRS